MVRFRTSSGEHSDTQGMERKASIILQKMSWVFKCFFEVHATISDLQITIESRSALQKRTLLLFRYLSKLIDLLFKITLPLSN